MESSLSDVRLTLVESTEEVEDFLRWLGERRPLLGVDCETTGLSLSKDRIRLVQFGDENHGWAFDYRNWRGVVKQVLERYDRPKVYMHAKFEAGMFMWDGLPFSWEKTHDVGPMLFLNNSLGPKALKSGARLHVDPHANAGQKALDEAKRKHKWTWETVPIDFLPYWGYGALDPVLTARLALKLWQPIQYAREAYDLEMAVQRVLCGMEMRGMRIDVDYCAKTRQELSWKHDALIVELGDLNPHSPDQVIARFLEQGVNLTKRTDKGKLSVDDEVLEEIAWVEEGQRPTETQVLAQQVRDARGLQKTMASYFDNFLEERDGDLLHAHIHQLAARTGRMSVSEPPLQQVPKNSFVRDAFIARENHRLVMADYDNEELRVMASLSKDANMIAKFAAGVDLHIETAERAFGKENGIAKRSLGKKGIFTDSYGSGDEKLARSLHITLAQAKALKAAIKAAYPGISLGMADTTRVVRERAAADQSDTGYVILMDGRRIRVLKDKAYVGWNARVQGTCAVVLKRALVDLDAAGLGHTLVLPVHDEIVFDIPEDQVEDAVPVIEQTMRRDDFLVPLTATAKVADRWGDPYRGKED